MLCSDRGSLNRRVAAVAVSRSMTFVQHEHHQVAVEAQTEEAAVQLRLISNNPTAFDGFVFFWELTVLSIGTLKEEACRCPSAVNRQHTVSVPRIVSSIRLCNISIV